MGSKKLNVLLIWKISNVLLDYIKEGLQNPSDFNFIVFEKENVKTLTNPILSEVEIIIGWRPTKELLEKAKKCKLFINPGAGVQHLIPLFKSIQNAEIPILVNGHGNALNTAEHAVAMLIGLSQQIIPHHNWMVEGNWRYGDEKAKSIQLSKRKIGLLGFGHVNKRVKKLLSGFVNEFWVLKREWSTNTNLEESKNVNKFTIDNLDGFLKNIDVLIIALPLTSRTKGLIGEKELRLLGEKGILVNVGRGELINEKALYESLDSKKIQGAAIDVWYNYQPEEKNGQKRPYNYPFEKLNNILMSPHRAASPFSDFERWNEVIENLNRYQQKIYPFLNEVNLKEEY